METKQLSASKVLKTVFWCFTLAFLVAAMVAGDRASMLSGLGRLLTTPAQITKDYFEVGSVSAAFLNAGLVGAVCCLLMCIPGFQANGTTAIAYFLTVGFSFWA